MSSRRAQGACWQSRRPVERAHGPVVEFRPSPGFHWRPVQAGSQSGSMIMIMIISFCLTFYRNAWHVWDINTLTQCFSCEMFLYSPSIPQREKIACKWGLLTTLKCHQYRDCKKQKVPVTATLKENCKEIGTERTLEWRTECSGF